MTDPALAWFAACAALVAAIVPGYSLWLRRIARLASVEGFGGERRLEHGTNVEVVVAVLDEAEWIEGKLSDLAALEAPPGGLTFWIVDGASSDDTPELVARWAERDPRFRLLRTRIPDKIAQLNAVLPLLRAPWVVVTDADARLAPDTVTALLEAAASDPLLAVAGVPVEPADSHPLERLHWKLLNRLRRAEARRGCAAIVTGPCYLFRREIVADGFPSDAVADDVHVAFAAAAAGRRVGFVDRPAVELRAPRSFVALFRHKLRKAEAYLREVVRFLPQARRLATPAREVFLWRAAQLMLFPLAALGAGASLAAWIAPARPGDVAAWAAAAATPFLLDFALALGRRRPARLGPLAALGLLLAIVLLVALVGLPFRRRTAAYPKIAGPLRARGATP